MLTVAQRQCLAGIQATISQTIRLTEYLRKGVNLPLPLSPDDREVVDRLFSSLKSVKTDLDSLFNAKRKSFMADSNPFNPETSVST
jgi:hypothetical protein